MPDSPFSHPSEVPLPDLSELGAMCGSAGDATFVKDGREWSADGTVMTGGCAPGDDD